MENKSIDNPSSSDENVTDPNEIPAQTPTPQQSNEIPNGGLKAWIQVLGSFFLIFNSWGIINTFGVYQTYYESALPESPSSISWIGSIQAYLLLLVGSGTGPLFDAGYFRALIISGSFLVVFGMMMTSICQSYWEIMLAQAVCVGIGFGCLFVPSVAIIATYFSTRKALAMGIAAAGSSLGGTIYPIVFRKLQPQIGFGWATRVLAFIMLALQAISISTMRPRILPTQKGAIWDFPAFRELPFTLFTIGAFFVFMGQYIPFFYVPSYAIQDGIMSEDVAFYMLSVLNAASFFGRIIPNFLADKTGPFNIIIPGTAAACILAFGWLGVRSTGGLIIFCILYGFFSGSFVSIAPTVVVALSPSMGVVGTRMGMVFSLGGLGLLVGTPVAGQLVLHASFQAAIYFCGAVVALGVGFMVAARVAKAGSKLMVVV